MVGGLGALVPIVNGSGPDESMIGTEKIPIGELMALNALEKGQWVDHLICSIDYAKIPESSVAPMLREVTGGFLGTRREIAHRLLGAPSFCDFQRRFHAITVLQDHILELSSVAGVLGHAIEFPYLTNDIFRIIFSTPFEALNASGVYKAALKQALQKRMPRDFVHRPKIGFQSPSRPYFMSPTGLGGELSKLLSRRSSALLNMQVVAPAVQERLGSTLDLRRRYDFLEWTAYNLLLLEELLA
jgi:hypothetical protein